METKPGWSTKDYVTGEDVLIVGYCGHDLIPKTAWDKEAPAQLASDAMDADKIAAEASTLSDALAAYPCAIVLVDTSPKWSVQTDTKEFVDAINARVNALRQHGIVTLCINRELRELPRGRGGFYPSSDYATMETLKSMLRMH